ncbi:MAG TPA: rod shape-determining protein MreD [Acidimicrobiia bacterium]
MRGRDVVFALTVAIFALVLQSTVFAEGRIELFGASPDLTILAVIATARHLEPEPALLVGFTSGLFADLLGGAPLGLWAIALTVVAYVTVRLRARSDHGLVAIGVGVLALTAIGEALFALTGTLFGQRLLMSAGVLRLIFLPAVWNVALAGAVLPPISKVLARDRTRSWRP